MTPFLAAILISTSQTAPATPMSPIVLETDLDYGKVRIFLPRHFKAGDNISGSVFASPIGADWDSQHASLEFLDSLMLQIGGTQCKIGDAMFQLEVPANGIVASIEDSAGHVYASCQAPAAEGEGNETTTEIAQQGMPLGVSGKFDGNRNQTEASLDGLSVGILAESNDEVFVTGPAERQGPIQLRVQEGARVVNAKVNILSLNFMTPAKATDAGKKSSIGVEISGLQDLSPSEYPIDVRLVVNHPNVARFEGPNPDYYDLTILSPDVADGNVLKSVPFLAVNSGSYRIRADIYPQARGGN